MRISGLISAVILTCGAAWPGDMLFADIITLKSGKIIAGKIIEKQKEYIKIDTDLGALYYEIKCIQGIEEDPSEFSIEENLQDAPELFFKKGILYASQNKFDEAEIEFNMVTQTISSGFDAVGALSLLRELKDGQVTKEYASHVFRGLERLMNREYRDAIPYLKQALAIKAGDPDVLYNLALAHYFTDDYFKTIEYSKQILEFLPEDGQVCRLLAHAYYLNGQYPQAVETLILSRELFRKSGDPSSAKEIDDLLRKIEIHNKVTLP
jgi:tetratricopeptide (TPR) repeat protein